MRISLFAISFLLSQVISAQIIDFSQSLFKIDGFFQREAIQNNKIRFIKITSSYKKDGKKFQDATSLITYNFSKKGLLVGSKKYISLSHKIDTAVTSFFYDKGMKLYKRIERQGPFRFDFHFQYKDNLPYKEVKRDGNSNGRDTAYVRFFHHKTVENKTTTTVLNAVHKPFQVKFKEIDSKQRVIKQETQFTRSSNNYKVSYTYNKNHLIQKKESSYWGESDENTWTFSYQDNKVEGISLEKFNIRKKKYAILYDDNDLPSAIIERNIQQKEVIVYKFQYIYYD